MIPMQNWTPTAQNPFQAMVVDAVRTILPTVHTQINQARLNTLQFRQAAIRAADKSIKSGLEADKQFFELAQAMLPIAYKQVSRMRLSLLEIHKASISSLSQAMEQSLKTDQQLYDLAIAMRKTKPGNALAYMKNWVRFQKRFNEVKSARYGCGAYASS